VLNWRDPQHSLAGGAELYAWEFARALAEAGARVDFVTAREPHQASGERVDGVDIRRRGRTLTFYPCALLWLLLRRRHLDVVLDADCGIPVFSPLVLWRRRTAIILLVHHVHLDQFSTYFPPPVAWFGKVLEGWLMPRLYRGLTTVAVSSSTAREMVERLGWRGPIHLLHNGNAMPVRRGVEPVPAPDRVAVLGRLAPHKRVMEVVRAVNELRSARPAIHLDVIGRGPDLDALQALVQSLRLEEHVTLHGYLEDDAKQRQLSSNRLHVSASDGEGWGQVVIEAAALGIPTLARDVPGTRDSVHEGVTGWLLSEPPVKGPPLATRLARGIDAALAELDDETRRREIGIACERWAAGFSWPVMHDGAVSLVEVALNAPAGGRR
jgi:glycosyltransferase involved in cell wall biosynthesis